MFDCELKIKEDLDSSGSHHHEPQRTDGDRGGLLISLQEARRDRRSSLRDKIQEWLFMFGVSVGTYLYLYLSEIVHW